MDEMNLKKGDEFIRISKYGKVFGVVDEIFHVTVHEEKCNYEKIQVRSTNGIVYDCSECFKVSKKLNEEEIQKRKIFFANLKRLSELKGTHHLKISSSSKE